MLKAALVTTLFFGLFVWFMQFDDDLTPQASSWITKYEQHIKSTNPTFDFLMSFDKDASGRQIPMAKGDLFCTLKDAEDCYLRLMAKRDVWEKEIIKHKALIENYQRYLKQNGFVQNQVPDLQQPEPHYSYLISAQRLMHLEWLSSLYPDKKTAALSLTDKQNWLSQIEQERLHLRLQLVQSDSTLYKMVLVRMLNENLNLQAVVSLDKDWQDLSTIPALTIKERSFQWPAMREFYGWVVIARRMDKNADFFEQGGNANPYWVRAIFKPNMSINEATPYWQSVVTLSEKSDADMVDALKKQSEADLQREKRKVEINWRNYTGSVLNHIAMPNYTKYIANLFELNEKIFLLNRISALHEALEKAKTGAKTQTTSDMAISLKFAALKSPYRDAYPVLFPSSVKVCYLPIIEKARAACIPVKW